MGGYVVQKHLESQDAPAGVLLASIPTTGILGMFLRWLKRHPGSVLKMLLLLDPWYLVSIPAEAKDMFFSDDYPNKKFLGYYPSIQSESVIMAMDASILHLPRPQKVKTPLLVIGAENDRIFTVAEQRKTARAYNTEVILYPQMAHDMMLEPGWETVADRILNWLDTYNL